MISTGIDRKPVYHIRLVTLYFIYENRYKLPTAYLQQLEQDIE